MNYDPTIEDEMVANGYVRCGGCGGFLPAGAICGYCLQKQQAAAQAVPAPRVAPKTTKPLKAIVTIGLCAVAVCGVGLAAIAVIKGAGRVTHFGGAGSPGSSSVAAVGSADGTSALQSKANQNLVAALNSGNTEQALSALQAAGSTASPVMQQTAPNQTPVMQSGPSATGSTMQSESKAMPDDIRRWLEHLQRTEQARVALAVAQLQESVKTLAGLQAGDINHAMGGDDEDDSKAAEEKRQTERAQKVGTDMATMQQAWRTLQSAFDSVQPPAECVAIKGNYDQVIGQTGVMITEIVSQIRNASKDPQAAVAALTAMQGTSKSKIDVPARATDSGVATVCRKYDTVKWFDIQSDVGSGVMSQLGF